MPWFQRVIKPQLITKNGLHGQILHPCCPRFAVQRTRLDSCVHSQITYNQLNIGGLNSKNNCFNYSSACSCKGNDAQPCGAFRQSIENVLEHACGGMSKTTFFRACLICVYLVESSRSSAIGFGWWVAMSPLGGKYTGPVRWCDMSLKGRNSKWTRLEEISQLWTYV